MLDANAIFALLTGFFVTLFIAVFIVGTVKFHGHLSLDNIEGVQKFHHEPTPRIGGIALMVGYFAGLSLLNAQAGGLVFLIGIAGIPALVFGLAEDFTKNVSVRVRLIATLFSGALFVLASGYALQDSGMMMVNFWLAFPVVSLAFTAFAIGGVANSINLIDGFNGLAIGTLLLVSLAFALVGWRVSDIVFVKIALFFASIFAGIFIVNFPSGKLFLGDGGAYFCGYLVAVLAVMLPLRNPEISPWVSLLILGYPVTETVVSIGRRLLTRGGRAGQPDSGHLHHKIYRNWSAQLLVFWGKGLSRNAVTSTVLWLIALPIFIFAAFAELTVQNALLTLSVLVTVYSLMFMATVPVSPKKPSSRLEQQKMQSKS